MRMIVFELSYEKKNTLSKFENSPEKILNLHGDCVEILRSWYENS